MGIARQTKRRQQQNQTSISNQSYNSKPPKEFPTRTLETEKWYAENYKQFWLDTELTFSTKEDTQTPFLLEILKRECDLSKISTVLDVGIGFGRVAKALLDDPDNVIDLYDGVDISELAIKQSEIYLDDHIYKTKTGKKMWNTHTGYCYMVGDFLELGICESYDLVLSVETMTGLPTNEIAQQWIDLMVSRSKKYVVNLDYHEESDSNVVFNNGRDYQRLYLNNENVIDCHAYEVENYHNVYIYIARVK